MMAATLGDLNLVSPHFDKRATSFIDCFCNHCLSSSSLREYSQHSHVLFYFQFRTDMSIMSCTYSLQSLLQQLLGSTWESCTPLQSSLNLTRCQHERKKSGPIFLALNFFLKQFCGTLQLQSQAFLKTTVSHDLLVPECWN